MGWADGLLVGLDFETTGVDPLSDRPVQVAVIWAMPDGEPTAEVALVDPGREIPEAAVAIHGITTERARRDGCTLREAALLVNRAMFRAAEEAVPVVAMNASFDLTIADELFRENGLPDISWRRVLDPLVLDRHLDRYRKGRRRLDALCLQYDVGLEMAHDAGADACAAVQLTRAVARRYPRCAATDPERLTTLQVGWHRDWAVNYDAWRRSQGLDGLAPEELSWPVRHRGRNGISAACDREGSGALRRGSATSYARHAPTAVASATIPLAQADCWPAGRNAEPFLW